MDKTYSERHPYRFMFYLELVIVGVYLLAGALDHFVHFGDFGLYVVANAALTLIGAVILTRKRWWKVVGFRSLDRRDAALFLVPLIPVFLNLYPGMRITGLAQVVGFLALALMVGFVEESFFRGLMLRAVEPRGVWRSVLLTTVLFSVTHLMNILAGEGGIQAGLQLLYTFAIGFAFAALAIRTRTIWPLVVIHALIDYVVFLRDPALVIAPGIENAVDIAVTVLFFAYGVFILRSVKHAAASPGDEYGAAAQTGEAAA